MKEFKTSIPCEVRVKGKILTELDSKILWNSENLECVWQDDLGHWHLIEFATEEEFNKYKFKNRLKGK